MAAIFTKGTGVWSESPVYSMQLFNNRKSCAACYCCAKFIGSLSDMVRKLDGKRRKNDFAGCLPCANYPVNNAKGHTSSHCDHVYCSIECRQLDETNGHNLVCISNEDSQYKQSLMGQYFTFATSQPQVIRIGNQSSLDYNYVYAAEILARIINCALVQYRVKTSTTTFTQLLSIEISKYFQYFYGLESVNNNSCSEMLYWRYASYLPNGAVYPSTDKHAVSARLELEDQCNDSWYLFNTALLMEKKILSKEGIVEDISSLLNVTLWSQVLLTIDLYFQPITIDSPLVEAAKSLRTASSSRKLSLYQELTNNYPLIECDNTISQCSQHSGVKFIEACQPTRQIQDENTTDCLSSCASGTNIVARTIAVNNNEVSTAADGGDHQFETLLDRRIELLIQQAEFQGANSDINVNSKCLFSNNPTNNPYTNGHYQGIALISSIAGFSHVRNGDGQNQSQVRTLVHSCVPNIAMETINNSLESPAITCRFVALSSITQETELRFSYLTRNDGDLNARNEQLQRKICCRREFAGLTVQSNSCSQASLICSCSRCVYEWNNSDSMTNSPSFAQPNIETNNIQDVKSSNKLSNEVVLQMGYLAMQESRTDDATPILVGLIRKLVNEITPLTDHCAATLSTAPSTNPIDNELIILLSCLRDSIHALGAHCLESDCWELGHLIWSIGYQYLVNYCNQFNPLLNKSLIERCALDTHLLSLQCIKDRIYSNVHHNEHKDSIQNIDVLSLNYHHRFDIPVGLSQECSSSTSSRSCSLQAGKTSTASIPSIYISSIPLLTREQCDRIISQTEDHIQSMNGGQWFTSRHYSVPTTDIAAHAVPALQDWFCRDIVAAILKPLFLKQFRSINESSNNSANSIGSRTDDVVIHDVFVVKYCAGDQANTDSPDATAQKTQKSLPLHCDQSSHSFVITLSDSSFEIGCKTNNTACYAGGGTYFPSLSGTGVNILPNHYSSRTNVSIDNTSTSISRNNGICPSRGHIVTFRGGDLMHGGETVMCGTRYIIAGFVYLRPDAGARTHTYGPSSIIHPVSGLIACLSPHGSTSEQLQQVQLPIYDNSFISKSQDTRDSSNPSGQGMVDIGKRRIDQVSTDVDAATDEGGVVKEFKFSFDEFV